MDGNDVAVVAGTILVAVGVWFIYWPLAPIVIGVMLVALGLLGARAKAASDERRVTTSHRRGDRGDVR